MRPNPLIMLAASLLPLVLGFVWFHPKVLGRAWQSAAGISDETLKGGRLPLIFALTFVLSFFLSVALFVLTVHQSHFNSLMLSEPGFGEAGSATQLFVDDFMSRFGTKHRSFGHGALHGALGAFYFALPVIGILALFERRGWKYVLIHAGYWFLTFALMGGLICGFA